MSSPQQLKERLAEAARYALLRRLAPALRHNMAGSLQPIGMMSSMLEKRLQKPEPDLPALARSSAALNTLSREGAAACMALTAWLAPNDNEQVAFDACLEQALGLVNTELSFKGLTLVNETGGLTVQLPRGVVCHVVMAALIALADVAVAPANIVLTAEQLGDELLIAITVVATHGETMPIGMTSYRGLHWDDVQALAEAESVLLAGGAECAELRYRLV